MKVKQLMLVVAAFLSIILTFGVVACDDSENEVDHSSSPTIETSAMDTEINFPDPGLQSAIRKAVGKPEIYASDLAELAALGAPDMNISDLTGIEYCINLTILILGNNQISDLSPLASLTNLFMLDLTNNQIGDLSPLADLKNLTALSLECNKITDITPLSSLTKLTSLGLNSRPGSNEIRDISPLASLKGLRDVSLWNNQISDASPLLSLPNLEKVFVLEGNPLESTSLEVIIPQLEEKGVVVF